MTLWDPSHVQEALQSYHQLKRTFCLPSSTSLLGNVSAEGCLKPANADRFRKSIRIIRSTLRLFGPAHTVISFNGGKDAVVIMHLYRLVLANYYNAHRVPPEKRLAPLLVYFRAKTEFQEVESFIEQTAEKYGAVLRRYDDSYENAMRQTLNDVHLAYQCARCDDVLQERPVAFIMGLRIGDPDAHAMGQFEPSSDWLKVFFMRVNPILHWDYGNIWDFLGRMNLDYCSLYDKGYTSLGTAEDTRPNPSLLRSDGTYRPARELSDWSMERQGRLGGGKLSFEDKAGAPPPLLTEMSSQEFDEDEDGGSKACGNTHRETPSQNTRKESPAAKPGVPFTNAKTTRVSGVRFSDSLADCRTAGFLIIGDEILKAQVHDCNTTTALVAMRQIGMLVSRVTIVPDQTKAIMDEMLLQLDLCDVVITSGGIGPTHDDLTMEAVSRIFGMRRQVHTEMVTFLQKRFNKAKLSEHDLRFAELPVGAKLHWPAAEGWPIMQVHRLLLLPGVPAFFQSKIEFICQKLLPHRPVFVRSVTVPHPEHTILSALDRVVQQYPAITFGCYGKYEKGSSGDKTMVTAEGTDLEELDAALRSLSASE